MDIWIIIIALVLFTILAFKRVSALILGPLVSLFVIVCSKLPMFDTMLGPYMNAAANYVEKFFLVFFVGAVFGSIMQETGAAESIAHSLIKITNGKFVAPLIMIITGLLTYGGISGFVVFFAMYPIAVELFKSANLSRRLIPAAISAGAWTWSMTGPGSPSIQNIIAMRYLETSSTAALLPAIASALAQLILICVWFEYRSSKLTKKGYTFYEDPTIIPYIDNKNISKNNKDLPNPIMSAIPAILILICFNIIELPVEGAVTIGIISAIVLLWKRIDSPSEWINTLNKGAINSATAILNTAIVVGFAGVVKETPGFEKIINKLKTMKMSPMLFVAITVAIASGSAGSASGGLGIAFESLKDTYINMGVNLEYVHRISVIASGTFDTLPHQGAQITLLAICGLTHKEGYFDIAMTQIIFPILVLLLVTIPMCSIGL
ncbi:citrate transporter [Clostridium tetani]|uniref:Citrate transporter n=1 Tax=Clostridium tetani TaxID=1513 RepID=A0ABC8EA75_CLOTA|nr:SLC13 family permease [Clostridium tetani]AVP55392.1 propionate permease [Clostridium tetani]RXI77272.1 GntP family permease [Clostridium tetani]WFN62316.1 SLC13 family permease [Clostridium tetani]SUY54498.1 propionate permease [Clostridium tetani]BDR66080.1 citrate transporter [Clostridium tetani]